MSGMFFSMFLRISSHISLGLHSLDSAEAKIWRVGKLNSYLIASCVGNIYTKNY